MSLERFLHPEWFLALASLACAAALAVWWARARARRRLRLLLGASAPPCAPRLSSDAMLLVAAVTIAVALLGPRLGERVALVPSSGVDAVFVIDVSRSMDANDVAPSRLDRARRAVEQLLARLGAADRAGLVAFAGRGLLVAPLTPDRDALVELLARLDTELVSPASSDLRAGVETALEALSHGGERPRVVFLASDGEDPEGRSDVGAAQARSAGVRVITAAFGTELGAFVPDRGGAPLVDASGRRVVSRRRTSRLERLADATDGAYFAADDWGRLDVAAVAGALRRDAGLAPGQLVERRVRATRVVPFAGLAFALLLLEGAPRPRRPLRAAAAFGSAAIALLLIAATPTHPRAAEPDAATRERAELRVRALERQLYAAPASAALLVELGAARLEAGAAAAAERAFFAASAATTRPEIAARASYDLGVAALAGARLETARAAFFDALAFDPRFERARFNLEWTLAALRRQPPEPPARPQAARPPDAPSDPEAPEASDPAQAPRPPPQAEAAPSEPSPRANQTDASPPALDAARRQRLLERVTDDPTRALRAAGQGDAPPTRRSAPVW